ncbi:MAG: hypothetical protein C6P37_16150 [Caldibacillus debilis]|uniref:Uncharacterized protein n=1 Tax=Caldibacillus debilis TaxID=301148 RepID=A0A3E0JWW1_9BACI|nr:MAG: hypothetical protein C6W57_13395 [Caldibacillus debilis]REJ23899.1 MAG: hypothetical protein C6W56_14740 [Caldibacillus debilis]REJ24380.1 MAG: hypothetical protein C6P37_16150 [Caldibacillus debilis]
MIFCSFVPKKREPESGAAFLRKDAPRTVRDPLRISRHSFRFRFPKVVPRAKIPPFSFARPA